MAHEVWMRTRGLHKLGDEGSLIAMRALAERTPGGLWCVRQDKDVAAGTRYASPHRWLNGGTTGRSQWDDSDVEPAWSTVHAALYTEDTAAAIMLALEGWVGVRTYRMF